VTESLVPPPTMDERAGIVAVICPTPWARSNEPFPVSRVDCDPAPVWVADRVKSTLGAAAEFEAEAARVPWAAAGPFSVEPDVLPPKTAAPTATAARIDADATATATRLCRACGAASAAG